MPNSSRPFDGELTVVAAKARHWRDKSPLACTFASKRGTLREALRKGMLPNPHDDYVSSLGLIVSGASLVTPLPSLASQIENLERYTGRISNSIHVTVDWYLPF